MLASAEFDSHSCINLWVSNVDIGITLTIIESSSIDGNRPLRETRHTPSRRTSCLEARHLVRIHGCRSELSVAQVSLRMLTQLGISRGNWQLCQRYQVGLRAIRSYGPPAIIPLCVCNSTGTSLSPLTQLRFPPQFIDLCQH